MQASKYVFAQAYLTRGGDGGRHVDRVVPSASCTHDICRHDVISCRIVARERQHARVLEPTRTDYLTDYSTSRLQRIHIQATAIHRKIRDAAGALSPGGESGEAFAAE